MNLLGCVLSAQLPTMTGLAFVYVSMSIAMFTQHLFFTYCGKQVPEMDEKDSKSSWLTTSSPRQAYISHEKRAADLIISPSKGDDAMDRRGRVRSNSSDDTMSYSHNSNNTVLRSILMPLSLFMILCCLTLGENNGGAGSVLSSHLGGINSTVAVMNNDANVCGASSPDVSPTYTGKMDV